jgi:uncharacterized membrane protein
MSLDRRPRSTRTERTITLTDAVVAIAMTLLVLPLVELAGEIDPAHLGETFGAHREVFLGFGLSFLVIYVFWLAHDQALTAVRDLGPALRSLNMLWLLVVAFLPFPTAVIGREVTRSSTPFYIGTMFVLSLLTSAMIQIAHPRPVAHDARRTWRRRSGWAWATSAVFGGCALAGGWHPDLGLFGLLLLGVIRLLEFADLSRTARGRVSGDLAGLPLPE